MVDEGQEAKKKLGAGFLVEDDDGKDGDNNGT